MPKRGGKKDQNINTLGMTRDEHWRHLYMKDGKMRRLIDYRGSVVEKKPKTPDDYK